MFCEGDEKESGVGLKNREKDRRDMKGRREGAKGSDLFARIECWTSASTESTDDAPQPKCPAAERSTGTLCASRKDRLLPTENKDSGRTQNKDITVEAFFASQHTEVRRCIPPLIARHYAWREVIERWR